jgi:NAD(P)-dependent dehydrogenase (short-subunit alcohol dehydrogenase family)
VVEAVRFLISPDAGHVDGSELVVDGGQSLQSWSNAPRDSHYPLTLSPSGEAPSERRFLDRVVLITGASGGLGSATARRFAAEGASLALLDRDGPAVTRLADELRATGVEALPVAVDVTDEAAMAAAITQAEQHYGQLNVLFNNAGIGSRDLSVEHMAESDWDEVIAINLRGVFLGCKYGVPALARAGGGAIVNMGSSTGRHDTITGGAAYMASKAAVEALTKSLALQVAPQRIRANTICPGIIQTQLSFRQQERGDAREFFCEFARRIPLGRVGQPDDVAGTVAFLASDQAQHITGASLLIDGGQTLRRWISAPTLAYRWEIPQ